MSSCVCLRGCSTFSSFVHRRRLSLPDPYNAARFAPVHTSHPRSRLSRVLAFQPTDGPETDKIVYQGTYGPWSIEQEDVAEVYGYRIGLSIATLAFLWCSSLAILPEDNALYETVKHSADVVCLAGAAGFATSLALIHIYVTFLKRTLQALFAMGLLGGIALITNSNPEPAALQVAHNPWLVWQVGPLFAALTGVAFKEGLCYGKAEAAALFFALPVLLLGHLSGWMPEATQEGLLLLTCGILAVFAGRKYTQAIKDDIGDKSVFEFYKLSEEEQRRVMAGRGSSSE